MEPEETHNCQSNSEGRKKKQSIMLLVSILYYKATVINTVWY